MTKFIIIRGNSGSGKTVIARNLRNVVEGHVLLVEQDMVRRHMLNVCDKPNNTAIQLIKTIILYGFIHCDYVILEGILNKKKYGDMLNGLIEYEGVETYAYYFDLPFKETVRRHLMKKDTDFGEEKMAKWFVANDFLGLEHEKTITSEMSIEDMILKIQNDIK
ncbi:hypothetical protein BU056_06500 [Staphylococcus succinus]|nr:hypothetical protein BU056_06500 [Staphylococcus succinus]